MGEMAAGVPAPFEFLLDLTGSTEEHEEKERTELDIIMTFKIEALGGRANNAPTYDVKCTHVISYKPIRSEKFICGVASGKWILKPDFITESFAKGKWQAESKYEWSEDDASENVPTGLLTAPRRWREKMAASGHGAFHDWKVLLHVTNDKNTYAVWRRVLEAGGGQCVPVTFPIKEPAGLVSLVTHVIVEECYEKDVQCLKERGILCLPPEFITEHLFQENPKRTQFQESSAFMTPPEPIRQKNIVVPKVKAKEDHDTFQNRSDTPESMVSLAEEGTSSDPGSSVKRKLDLDSLREPDHELLKKSKKRKNPNDASTSKAENVRRSPRQQSNTRKDEVSGGIIADHSPKFLPRKFDVNRKNGKGETPLQVACIKNDITKVRELLNKPDIDVNTRDYAEWTPLHEACIRGHTACVKELLKFASGKRMVTSTESRGMETLDFLAAPSECGNTPLHDAVYNNRIEVVKLLVEAGGKILLTAKNKAGFTPFGMALTEVMKEALLGQSSEVSRLSDVDEENENSTESRSMETMDLLAAPSDCGTTPLHDAVFTNHLEVVNPLVEAGGGSLLTCENNTGSTPVNMGEREEEANLGQRSEVNKLPAYGEENENRISNSSIMSQASGKHKCSQCSYSSKRRYDLKKHFSRKHVKGHIHGRESSPERTTPNHTAVQSTPVPGNAEKENGQQKALLVDSSLNEQMPEGRSCENNTGSTPVNMAEREEEANLGQRSEVNKLPAYDEENENSMAAHGGIADDLLSNLAEDIETGEQMEALGRTLGFKVAEINRYTETNRIEGLVTCKGTRAMLFDWRQTVVPCDQHIRLKQALIDAKLVMLADTHLKEIQSIPVSCSIIAHHSRRSSPRNTNVNRKNSKGGSSLLTCENNAGCTPVNVAEREEEGILGQRSEVNRLPAYDEKNENRRIPLTLKKNTGSTPVDMTQTEVIKAPILGQRSQIIRLPAVDEENKNRRILLAGVRNMAGLTPVDIAQTEVMKEANLGKRSEVSTLSAVSEENENNASTSKAVYVRRSPRKVKGGSKLDSNTTVKGKSKETFLSSKPNLGKDEAMGKLPSEKDDASATPGFASMDELLVDVADLVPNNLLYKLGAALKVNYAQIERYSVQNNNGSCKYEGTLKMLHVWTSKQKDNNIQGLSAALEKIGLNMLSESLKLNTI